MKFNSILGLNRRELELISLNPVAQIREIAQDKLACKKLLSKHGLPVPELYRAITRPEQLHNFNWDLPDEFALKPSGGGRGCGILVTSGRRGQDWLSHGGKPISRLDLRFHLLAILYGDFSREGSCDHIAFFERKMKTRHDITGEPALGLPDLRVIVCAGKAVMAMTRIPTRASDGKANLHQGAIGVGIDVHSGATRNAVLEGEVRTQHPDTGRELVGLSYPNWPELRALAIRAAQVSELGYAGVDIVVDDEFGPAILEINARPGLDIQIANLMGLRQALAQA